MITGGHQFPAVFEDVFPAGCVMGADGVVPVKDFAKKGQGDDQERDKRAVGVEESVSDGNASGSAQPAVALTSAEVFPADPPVVVLRGGLAVGVPCYDAVAVEHLPLMPGGDSCRACGFVYTDRRVCPALILAAAGYPVLADRVRVLPAATSPPSSRTLPSGGFTRCVSWLPAEMPSTPSRNPSADGFLDFR